jgi:hypothetical protein
MKAIGHVRKARPSYPGILKDYHFQGSVQVFKEENKCEKMKKK